MLALVAIPTTAVVILGVLALMRCNREDIPRIVEAIGKWFGGSR